jgi:cilia- and flagella-associated protein 44
MKLITYYQELLVLVDMEDHDNKLINNLLNYKQERTKLQEEGDIIAS